MDEIQYQHTLADILDPIPQHPQYLICSVIFQYLLILQTVVLFVNQTNLTGIYFGTISIETEILVTMSEDGNGMYILEKSFSIQGRTDGMVLMCRFNVTTDGIELNAMSLKLPVVNDITSNQTNNL